MDGRATGIPTFLPDGRHFLYWSGQEAAAAIWVGDVDGGAAKILLPEFAPALYAAPGWLIYIRNGTLVAHAFDADRLELAGEPRPIASVPLIGAWARGGRLSLSETGALLVQNASEYDYQLTWHDRAGARIGTMGPVRTVAVQAFPRISPDGARVVAQWFDPVTANQDLWIGDVVRGTFDRLTTNPAMEQLAVWSADGASVLTTTSRNGVNGIYRISVAGDNEQNVATGTVFPADTSPDGKWFFFLRRGETTRMDVWVQPTGDNQAARAILHSDADELSPEVSPDNRWLAYASDVSGTSQVYVGRLGLDGAVSGVTRVSTDGGSQPRWSRDGRELFFVNASQGLLAAQFMTASVNGRAGSFEHEAPKPLFKARMVPLPGIRRDYDVSLDGRRFLIGTAAGNATASPATILLNWPVALER
jgi:hypothetical protein